MRDKLPEKMRGWARVLWVGVVALVLLLGLALALSWAPDRPVDELKGRWAGASSASKFVDVQGLAVHVRDEGPRSSLGRAEGAASDKEPLVLLHGTSASLHTWDGWAAELSKTRRVIRLDLPGFGLTGPHEGQLQSASSAEDYSTAMYARFVVAALDALKLAQPVVLVGNSLGGQIAWEVALLAPARVSRLVLVDAAGYAFTSDSVPLGFRIARSPWLAPLMENTLPRALIAASVRNVYGDPSKVSDALVDRYYDMTQRAGNRRAVGLRMRYVMQELQAKKETAPQRIAQIKQPSLIVWGDRDQLIPLSNGERFAKDIAGAKLVVLPGLGHVPHEEDAAASLLPVKAFLGIP
jgi:pimeloyl-ACP methyl ester carboxylesterase